MKRKILCGMSPDDLVAEFGKEGLTGRHALKIANELYKRNNTCLTEVRGVPVRLLRLVANSTYPGFYQAVSSNISADGTVKYLFRGDEDRMYETVYIPDGKRHTVCVSSQAGCRMGCPFCATGRYGFHGNLTVGEIVSQVTGIPYTQKITHVVFMGMGEPTDNLDNVLKAIKILTAEWGRAISAGNITVSTVGITSGISRFLDESECNLTVSLFSPVAEERRHLLPVEKKYPVHEIISILKNSILKKKRRLTLSYVMINGLNDSGTHLEELQRLLRGSGIRVNLLPYHPVKNDKHNSSSAERMQYFKHALVTSGISASVRKSRGVDISAACGLLASDFSVPV